MRIGKRRAPQTPFITSMAWTSRGSATSSFYYSITVYNPDRPVLLCYSLRIPFLWPSRYGFRSWHSITYRRSKTLSRNRTISIYAVWADLVMLNLITIFLAVFHWVCMLVMDLFVIVTIMAPTHILIGQA